MNLNRAIAITQGHGLILEVLKAAGVPADLVMQNRLHVVAVETSG
jgi:hypothetical protein